MNTLPPLHGYEIRPGIWLIGEPAPIPGTDKMRCLADVHGALAVVEITVHPEDEQEAGK